MKAHLLFRDRDVDPRQQLPTNADELTQDLELGTLLAAMADGDPYLHDICRRTLLTCLDQPEEIVFRQDVLRDCLSRPDVADQMYATTLEAILDARKVWHGTRPDSMLAASVSKLQVAVPALRELRRTAEVSRSAFRSDGFGLLFGELISELTDEYFESVEDHLRALRFRDGILISTHLGPGNKGARYVLHHPKVDDRSWLRRITNPDRSGYSFQISDRDVSGSEALRAMRTRGITDVAKVLTESADHVLSFLTNLLSELAFYRGCINLHRQLTAHNAPIAFPVPTPTGQGAFSAEALYDISLRLIQDGPVTGNDIDATGRRLVVVTGANRGGKSTFLRSVGIAQLMMQCGMFAPASSFRSDVCGGVLTHFKREEDSSMESGKLDEELARMSGIVDQATPGCLLLSNESFSSTNEREGSEIARQIVRALLDSEVRVVAVTHLFELAHHLLEDEGPRAVFLRAERAADGHRTFRLKVGEPFRTSYGEDIYQRIFDDEPATPSRPPPELPGTTATPGGAGE